MLLSACNFGTSKAEEIYQHLERAVTLEEVFEQQQKPLVELETQEQKLYEQIIPLGMSEFEEIKRLSNEALQIVEQRRERMANEKSSIDAARAEFQLIEPIINEMEEGELKTKAEELYQVMSNRYDAYDTLYERYMNSLELDKTLYEMFQNEELTLDELEAQLDKINTSYSKVKEANDTFNQYTDEYNQIKKEFYNLAELNVVFSEDTEEPSGE